MEKKKNNLFSEHFFTDQIQSCQISFFICFFFSLSNVKNVQCENYLLLGTAYVWANIVLHISKICFNDVGTPLLQIHASF